MLKALKFRVSDSTIRSLNGRLHKSSRLYCSSGDKPAETIAGVAYNKLTIGVPRESFENEKRVALSPAAVATLTKRGFNVQVAENAGFGSQFLNDDYTASGASVVPNEKTFDSDIVLKVRSPAANEMNLLKDKSNLISFIYPAQNKVGTAQNKVGTAQNKEGTAQNKVGTAQNKVGTAQNKVGTAQNKVGTAQNKVGNAQNKVGTAQKKVGTAQIR